MQHALRGFLYGPGLGCAEVVFQESGDGCLACQLTDVAAADSVGNGDGNSLETQLRFPRNEHAVEILIGLLAAPIRILPCRYFQRTGHFPGMAPGLWRSWVAYAPLFRAGSASVPFSHACCTGSVR